MAACGDETTHTYEHILDRFEKGILAVFTDILLLSTYLIVQIEHSYKEKM